MLPVPNGQEFHQLTSFQTQLSGRHRIHSAIISQSIRIKNKPIVRIVAMGIETMATSEE